MESSQMDLLIRGPMATAEAACEVEGVNWATRAPRPGIHHALSGVRALGLLFVRGRA
jgi:hypothetical protein